MMIKNKKLVSLLTLIILVVAAVVVYFVAIEPNEKIPPSLSGKLKNVEADVENNTYKFKVILSNNQSCPKLKKDNLRMHMYATYKNGTEYSYAIFRYREGGEESDAFSFSYIDKNEDNLISTGDLIVVQVYIDVSQIEGYAFSFGTKSYAGSLEEYDRSPSLP